mmetsp:Transcript_56969/g.135526  ORF Transcript_56969/g.135526 Transcript_56969/m.135526 type:complete len:290 (-) Transcript_56969:55-924(-)
MRISCDFWDDLPSSSATPTVLIESIEPYQAPQSFIIHLPDTIPQHHAPICQRLRWKRLINIGSQDFMEKDCDGHSPCCIIAKEQACGIFVRRHRLSVCSKDWITESHCLVPLTETNCPKAMGNVGCACAILSPSGDNCPLPSKQHSGRHLFLPECIDHIVPLKGEVQQSFRLTLRSHVPENVAHKLCCLGVDSTSDKTISNQVFIQLVECWNLFNVVVQGQSIDVGLLTAHAPLGLVRGDYDATLSSLTGICATPLHSWPNHSDTSFLSPCQSRNARCPRESMSKCADD